MDIVSYLPDDLLVKFDRTAMAVSSETRVLLLDHRIIELALSLPLHISRAHNTPKWPLKQLLNRHVLKNLIDRRRWGLAFQSIPGLEASGVLGRRTYFLHPACALRECSTRKCCVAPGGPPFRPPGLSIFALECPDVSSVRQC